MENPDPIYKELAARLGQAHSKYMFGAVQMIKDPATGKERSSVDPEKCMGCGSCVVSCRNGARSMKAVRPPEHIPRQIARLY